MLPVSDCSAYCPPSGVLKDTHLVSGTTHYGGEHRSGSIIPGEACLTQSWSIVTHKGSAFLVVTHFQLRFPSLLLQETITTRKFIINAILYTYLWAICLEM